MHDLQVFGNTYKYSREEVAWVRNKLLAALSPRAAQKRNEKHNEAGPLSNTFPKESHLGVRGAACAKAQCSA